ncbi:hypothetical protein MSAN_01593500 [Mycena sanguinolenta]|uniref:Uncharacterized protein n=1 Tax=Mycena sanguinolenta TaxID=230812 RepID=A0A8H7CVB2_9AGAR|nr:hypothetical protein MSAN_01593500 [Mycena sanguinolenta]
MELEDPSPSETSKLGDALTTMPLLVNEEPTLSFRDNLRTDVRRGLQKGWREYPNSLSVWKTYQFIHSKPNEFTLPYALTERVPILPRFRPIHPQGNASSIDFSNIFDIARLRKELKTPILEWCEVELINPGDLLSVECSDISYTPVPKRVRNSIQMDQADRSMYLWPLASLIAFNKRATNSGALAPPLHQKAQAPDDQLFC